MVETNSNKTTLKLSFKRTILVSLPFLAIILLCQMYDTWCPTFLTELFSKIMPDTPKADLQYMVGIIMAFDNIAALFLMPLFGYLSDRTHTRFGKRMPYILVGSFICAVAFPFIPVAFHFNNVAGTICLMGVAVLSVMIYRNPSASLQSDITPKPLRSKAESIAEIIGYLGGAITMVVGIPFSISSYLDTAGIGGFWSHNIWCIEIPFLIASVVMLLTTLIAFIGLKENKLEVELKEDMEQGEREAEVNLLENENSSLNKSQKVSLLFVLLTVFFIFMVDNGLNTYLNNFTIYYLQCDSSSTFIILIIRGASALIGFVVGALIADKIGRKRAVQLGLLIAGLSLLMWTLFTFLVPVQTPQEGTYNPCPIYLYFVFIFEGFGLSMAVVNIFPMSVEFSSKNNVGKFTAYYYFSSMLSQALTAILIGLLMLIPNYNFKILPLYAAASIALGLLAISFYQNKKKKTKE